MGDWTPLGHLFIQDQIFMLFFYGEVTNLGSELSGLYIHGLRRIYLFAISAERKKGGFFDQSNLTTTMMQKTTHPTLY